VNTPVVSTRQLGKVLGEKPVLRDISLDVAPGSVVGLLGKNGAGKTTLLDVLLGFSPATSGTASVFGADSFAMPADVKRRIGFVPQEDELLESLTGAEQLALNASLHPHWDRALIDRLVREWEVPLDRRIQVLSGGERQKLATLLALGHAPDLLVLDEPAASLDPIARRRFLREILEIAESPSRTVLFSTHIVADIERVANRVWILREGALVWQGEIDALKESVVRVTITSRAPLPIALGLEQVLCQRREERRVQLVIADWRDPMRAELAARFDAEVAVEHLGLEEIFLEMHA
jgi:ABC-2 type transport system ATP-binding protein